MFDGRTIERFWTRVDRNAECWNWTAGCGKDGYGKFRANGRDVRAHRFSWMVSNGPIAGGLLVCHRCDNRKCVRASHLFVGTWKDNSLDAIRKGRRSRPGIANAKLDPDRVRQLRRMHADGRSRDEIAREFGISPFSIRDIVNGRLWSHVH